MDEHHYLASILLRSDSYETELNARILGALHDKPSVPDIPTPRIPPGSPNRAYFIDRFLSQLSDPPCSMEVTDPERVFQEQVDGYEGGRTDPVDPGGTWRAMALNVRMELGGTRTARLFFRESQDEKHVLATFAFDPCSFHGPLFREFLLALVDAYHAITGTLGLDLTASTGMLPDDAFRLENGMWLHRLNDEMRQAGYGCGYDFLIVDGVPWGWEKPFVFDGIEPRKFSPGADAGREYYDLRLVEEMRANAEQAEEAYSRMYESKRPKDDRDDALLFLSKSIRLAADMGFEKELARLKERYAHIDRVFNSQFRRL